MKLILKKTLLKDLARVVEPHKTEVKAFLEAVSENPRLLDTYPRIKKLRGKTSGNFFRIRFGDYRLGYEKQDDAIIVYRILHRREIYRYFP
jgi:mRNA interferase RelE/StbE